MKTIYQIEKKEIVRLDYFSGNISVTAGTLWVTYENEPQDRVLAADESLCFSGKNVVIEALTGSTFEASSRIDILSSKSDANQRLRIFK